MSPPYRTPCGLALLATLLLLPAAMGATEAIQNVRYTGPDVGYAVGKTGFAFTPTTTISVTALGHGTNFGSASGLSARVVELIDANTNLLASATLFTNDVAQGNFVYESIPPLSLAAGSTNYLVTYDWYMFTNYGSYVCVGKFLQKDVDGTFDPAPELQYLACTIGFRWYSASLYPPAPNFQFTRQTDTPLPPTLSLTLTATNAILLSWPANVTNAVLQTTPDLLNVNMTNVPVVPELFGEQRVVQLPKEAKTAFFRLRLE